MVFALTLLTIPGHHYFGPDLFAIVAELARRANFEGELVEYGFNNENVDIYSQALGFADREIFEDLLHDTFLPDLAAKRERYSYDGPAILILDSCTAHCGPRITEKCERNGLLLFYLPPHSSYFLQCLGLSIFGLTKKQISAINRMEDVDIQTSHILQILNGFMSAAFPTNIVRSFKNSGISFRREGQQVFCHVTAETEAAEQAEIESANLELGCFTINCAVMASGEHGEQGEHVSGGNKGKFLKKSERICTLFWTIPYLRFI
jgi:hypothetical protein